MQAGENVSACIHAAAGAERKEQGAPHHHCYLHYLRHDACADFDLLIVPADTTNPNVEEIRKSWETRILPCQVSHFHVLALECRDLPSEDGFDEAKRRRLLKLVEYEIRYLRGCDIRWVGGSLPGKGAESGPDNN